MTDFTALAESDLDFSKSLKVKDNTPVLQFDSPYKASY